MKEINRSADLPFFRNASAVSQNGERPGRPLPRASRKKNYKTIYKTIKNHSIHFCHFVKWSTAIRMAFC